MGGLFKSTVAGRILDKKKESGVKKGKRIAGAEYAKKSILASKELGEARSENANLLNTLKEEERTTLL